MMPLRNLRLLLGAGTLVAAAAGAMLFVAPRLVASEVKIADAQATQKRPDVVRVNTSQLHQLALFNSVRDSLLALSGIPFAVAGGILGLTLPA